MLRRVFASLGFTAAALLAFDATAAQTRTWDFRVFLGDTPIGHQRFSVTEGGAGSAVSISARLQVKVFGSTVYRYAHDASERWRDGCLDELVARTDDNGEQLAVSTEATASGLVAIGSAGRSALQQCPMSFAYWNPRILQQERLLNSQTGAYEAVKIVALGDDTIVARGSKVSARRYRIDGLKNPIDLWYSAEGEWLALESTVAGGRVLRYRLD